MNHQTFKIHNQEDFNRITRGIKVAQCMQPRSSSVSDMGNALNQLEDLVVSDTLSCSSCNTVFENKTEQRLHYKLDWHRYNLKQKLNGLKSVTKDGFNLLIDAGDIETSSLSSTTDSEFENEDEGNILYVAGDSSSGRNSKDNESRSRGSLPCTFKSKKREKKRQVAECTSESSDTECNDDISDERKIKSLLAVASRHSKVFFENEDGNIFSIYRCLLHNKKDIPEVDNEMIAQALDSGKRTVWTIIMVGGGHFAAAVFQDGEPIVHKTFHSYTVRAKQGASQNSRDGRSSGNHTKSAGASLRRYNESALTQHVQDILESWSGHIINSSLILYRAVGPFNRTVLFGGKNPPLEKSDSRLRPLPFPTRRATFSEVKRVYDILSTMEIYGSAANFKDSFPISPRQPIRKKASIEPACDAVQSQVDEKSPQALRETAVQPPAITERSHRSNRTPIDRAKPRKSPNRPLPDIVTRLALSSSESELDNPNDVVSLAMHSLEINFNEHLLAFQNSESKNLRNKKARRQRRNSRKDRIDNVASVIS